HHGAGPHPQGGRGRLACGHLRGRCGAPGGRGAQAARLTTAPRAAGRVRGPGYACKAVSVHAQRLGPGHDPGSVLCSLAAHAERRGLPAPVALAGDWLDSAAVLAPEVRLTPITAAQAFPPAPAPAPASARHGAETGSPVV